MGEPVNMTNPLFSIIIPTFNSNIKYLRDMFKSIKAQTCYNYEVCIVDDGSSDSQVVPTIKQYLNKFPNSTFTALSHNQGIAAASNVAISSASGKYLVLVDHDDLLDPRALEEVKKCIIKNPQADLIYTDEDHINDEGRIFASYRKSDWNPDLLLSNNYICHLSVYRAELIKDIGGFRSGFFGSQDYDLALRATELTNNIIHIPKVLYHWRIDPLRQVSTTSNKAFKSAIRALEDTLKRRDIDGTVIQIHKNGAYRIKRKIDGEPKVSIIIPTKDNKVVLNQCVKSIVDKTNYENYEICIVDNASIRKETINYFEYIIKAYKNKVKLLRYDGPFNFSAINNYAVDRTDSDYITLLNDDIEVIEGGWLEALLSEAQRPEVGAVGAKLLYPNGKIQHAGVIIGSGGVADHRFRFWNDTDDGYFFRKNVIDNVGGVTAACVMLRRNVFEEVEGLDEVNLKVAFNDVDLCLKIRDKGYLIVYTPFAKLFHHEGYSRGIDTLMNTRFLKEIKFMNDKWGDTLKRDPYWPTNIGIGDR